MVTICGRENPRVLLDRTGSKSVHPEILHSVKAELTHVVRTLAAALSKWNALTLLIPSVMSVNT